MIKFDDKKIKWKEIKEVPEYVISNTGIVINKRTMKIMKIFTKNRNYPTVALFTNGKTIQRFVHRLVAFAFVPNLYPHINKIVHHIDEDKMNYRADNLMWSNQGKNVASYITNHKGDTHIDRMKITLGSPILEFDWTGKIINEYSTPQGTGYHCKELYKCIKNHIPFRGHLFVYKDDIDKINMQNIINYYKMMHH